MYWFSKCLSSGKISVEFRRRSKRETPLSVIVIFQHDFTPHENSFLAENRIMRFIKHALGRAPCSRAAEKRARLLIPDIRSFQSDPPSHCFFSLFLSWCYYFFHPRFFSLLSRARIAKFDTKTHQVSLLNSFLSFFFFLLSRRRQRWRRLMRFDIFV